MINADIVRYKFRRYLRQTGGSCSTHAFLGVLAELVENKTSEHTDFNYEGEYEKIHDGKNPEGLPISKLARIAMTKGFETLDGRVVKITKAKKIGKYPTWEAQANALCQKIQAFGPGVLVVRWNYMKGNSLVKHKGGILTHVKKYVNNWKNKKDKRAHALSLTGFDKEKGVFFLANSWGDENSERMVRFEDLYKMFSEITFLEGVTVFKSLTKVK